jgi:hypothetical protein
MSCSCGKSFEIASKSCLALGLRLLLLVAAVGFHAVAVTTGWIFWERFCLSAPCAGPGFSGGSAGAYRPSSRPSLLQGWSPSSGLIITSLLCCAVAASASVLPLLRWAALALMRSAVASTSYRRASRPAISSCGLMGILIPIKQRQLRLLGWVVLIVCPEEISVALACPSRLLLAGSGLGPEAS